MSEQPKKNTPFRRVLDWFIKGFAILGACSIVFIAPAKIAEALQVGTVTKGVLVGSFCLLFAVAFLLAWAREWVLALTKDEPLPGFTEKTAAALKAIARRVLPDLPDRQRNAVVMAAGVSGACALLEWIGERLEYFINKRVDTLAKEITRESDFVAYPMQKLADISAQLLIDLKLFRQLIEPRAAALEALHSEPQALCGKIEAVEQLVEGVYEDLKRFHLERIHDQAQNREGRKRAEWKEEFSRLEKTVRDGQAQLRALAESCRHCQNFCRELVKHLDP